MVNNMKNKLNLEISKNQALLISAGIAVIALSLFNLITVRNIQQSAKHPAAVAEVGNAPTKGKGDAPVTIIEFSDFECPFCLKFQQETLPKLEAKYGNKVRFAYKHFPLTDVHPHAMDAALASSCAYFLGGNEAFFTYSDALFNRVNEWKTNEPKLASLSPQFDEKKFNACMQSDGTKRWVNKDIEDGKKLGVERVPTFFVNGIKVTGAQPFEFFDKLINQELTHNQPSNSIF